MKKPIQKHLEFCLKYPEVVMDFFDSVKEVQKIIDNGITPTIEYLKVVNYFERYENIDSIVFMDFKNIINDYKNLRPIKNK